MGWFARRDEYEVLHQDDTSEKCIDWEVVDSESGETICLFAVTEELPEAECERRARLCAEGGRVHLYLKEARDAGQAAGRALGYPWLKDDPANFPGATEADGVCIWEHTNVTVVEELADKYRELQREVERLREIVTMVAVPLKIIQLSEEKNGPMAGISPALRDLIRTTLNLAVAFAHGDGGGPPREGPEKTSP